jgi:hypothetical protein
MPHRIQALEAARLLNEALRKRVKEATADAQRSGENLRQVWDPL